MARVLGLLLLVAAALFIEIRGSPDLNNFCPNMALTSCDGLSCTCNSNDMFYSVGDMVNCSVCQDNVTYRVEFIPFSNSSCFNFINTTISDWQFRGLSHQPSCTVTSNDTCCDQSQILNYFITTGLDTRGELIVTRDYPYASVLAYLNVTNDENVAEIALRLSVDRLSLCSGGWQQSVQTCGVYLYPEGTLINSTCIGTCDTNTYAAGCFNFALTYMPECPTDGMPGTMETTATITGAGSVATPHNLLGLVALAFVVLQFLRAVIVN